METVPEEVMLERRISFINYSCSERFETVPYKELEAGVSVIFSFPSKGGCVVIILFLVAHRFIDGYKII